MVRLGALRAMHVVPKGEPQPACTWSAMIDNAELIERGDLALRAQLVARLIEWGRYRSRLWKEC
jgi:hypothetical protein